jgi:hypothetical protein
MPRITKDNIAEALDAGMITLGDLQDILDGWRPPKRKPGRRRIHFLKKGERDFLILATYHYLTTVERWGKEAAKTRTAIDCNVSISEVKRVLADQKKGIAELVPDD